SRSPRATEPLRFHTIERSDISSTEIEKPLRRYFQDTRLFRQSLPHSKLSSLRKIDALAVALTVQPFFRPRGRSCKSLNHERGVCLPAPWASRHSHSNSQLPGHRSPFHD